MEMELWEKGRKAVRDSLDLMQTGEAEQSFSVLESAVAQAVAEHRDLWVRLLCRHAALLANRKRDKLRELRYSEQALLYARNLPDYPYALYNLAQLALLNGHNSVARQYATEAYSLSIKSLQPDRDLTTAILKQWPNIGG